MALVGDAHDSEAVCRLFLLFARGAWITVQIVGQFGAAASVLRY
jgi:hypothetical protein